MPEPLKEDLQSALDEVSDLVDAALDPGLSREQLVERVREIGDAAELEEPEPEPEPEYVADEDEED